MRSVPVAAALVLALVLVPGRAAAQEPHAGHATHVAQDAHAAHGGLETPAPSPVPAGHRPWAPDPPLRQGMARVREAMAGLAHHEMGHLGESTVLALADGIDEAIADMFAHCKLDPEPDIALHGVLARLMAGTQALRADPASAAPVAAMRAAMADYARLFDDPAADPETKDRGGDRGT